MRCAWFPLVSVAASHDITSRCHPRATEDHSGRPKRRPRAAQSPPGVAQGPPEGPLEGPKTTKNAVLSTMFGFSAKRDFGAVKSAPRAAHRGPGGPRSRPRREPFWSDVGPSWEHFGPNFDRVQQHLRGNLLLHLRGAWAEPRRTAQRRSRKSCRQKRSKKSSKPPAGQMCRAHVPLAVVVDLRRSNGQ